MKTVEEVIKALEICKWCYEDYEGYWPKDNYEKPKEGYLSIFEKVCCDCPYNAEEKMRYECLEEMHRDALELLKEQQPRVLTLDEVMKHYSLPPVFVDDLGMQEDYLQDIQPLYFEFLSNDPRNIHWRGYQHIRQYLDHWKPSYGQKWRCWTARPTDEQRKAVKWE